MTPEQIQALMLTSNSVRDNVLIALVVVVVVMAFILPVIMAIMVVRVNAMQTQFILAMTGRSVAANETSNRNTAAQTQAIQGQSTAMEAMNKTGQSTGAAVESVDKNVKAGLAILGILGVDVKDLAKHAVAPTPETKADVQAIADKPAAPAPEAVAVPV